MVSETDENLEVDLELAEEENLNELSDETEETIESSNEYDSSEDSIKRPKKSLDATQMYLSEIGFSPLLSADEEKHYARLAISGDESGRKRMIESNLRLVVKISRRYLNRGLTLLDLIEEGNLGLIRAVEKFDPDRGFRFLRMLHGGLDRLLNVQ